MLCAMQRRLSPCRRTSSKTSNNQKGRSWNFPAPSVFWRILAAAILAAAVRGKKRGQRSVFVQTIQERDDDGQTATTQNVRAEDTVLTAEYEKRNQNPESRITLRKAIHKENLLLDRRGM